jgi:outer membrane receptor protein involved in Fe transport
LWGNLSYNASTLRPFSEFVVPQEVTIEQHHIVINDEGRLVGAPSFTANLGFDWELRDDLTLSPSGRYFTDQAAYDFTRQAFTTIDNRFYLDATLTLKKVWEDHLDLRLIGHNLLDNRAPVAGQWLRSTYRPRGIEVIFSLDLRL